jgi:hypothetical protein
MSLEKFIPAIILRLGRRGNNSQGHTGDTAGEKYTALSVESASLIARKLGNNCGFNPAKPLQHASHPEHKKRPRFLNNLIRLVNDVSKSRHLLPDLKCRAEVWDALNVILPEYLHYTCLGTLMIGISHPNGRFDTISNKTLLEGFNRGLNSDNQITESRHHAAAESLQEAGYLITSQHSKRKIDGEWNGSIIIRQFTPKFFLHLGISEGMLKDVRNWKLSQLRKQPASLEANHEIKNVLHGTRTPRNVAAYFTEKIEKPPRTYLYGQEVINAAVQATAEKIATDAKDKNLSQYEVSKALLRLPKPS